MQVSPISKLQQTCLETWHGGFHLSQVAAVAANWWPQVAASDWHQEGGDFLIVKNKWLNIDLIHISLMWYFMECTVNVLFMNYPCVICVNPSEGVLFCEEKQLPPCHWVRDCNTLLWRARFLEKDPSLLQDVVDTPFAKLLKLPPPHVLSSDNELKNQNQKRRLLGSWFEGDILPLVIYPTNPIIIWEW